MRIYKPIKFLDAAKANKYVDDLTIKEYEQCIMKALDCGKQRVRNRNARNVRPEPVPNIALQHN